MHSSDLSTDLLPENAFAVVSWLHYHDMKMYRWSGNSTEWTEYAMHVPAIYYTHLIGRLANNDFSTFNMSSNNSYEYLLDIQRRSGCKLQVEKIFLAAGKAAGIDVGPVGRECYFIVLHRGASGLPSNGNMSMALELISARMSMVLSHDNSLGSRQQSGGLLGNFSNNTGSSMLGGSLLNNSAFMNSGTTTSGIGGISGGISGDIGSGRTDGNSLYDLSSYANGIMNASNNANLSSGGDALGSIGNAYRNNFDTGTGNVSSMLGSLSAMRTNSTSPHPGAGGQMK